MAKASASDAGREVTAGAIQMHGGIGFTWEADVHWLYKRAQLDAALLGGAKSATARSSRRSSPTKSPPPQRRQPRARTVSGAAAATDVRSADLPLPTRASRAGFSRGIAAARRRAITARPPRGACARAHAVGERARLRHDEIGTFGHPRYELIATGEMYDGEAEVRGYYAESRAAFPDQRNEVLELHHADDTVGVEFILLGTHLGPLRGLPPTGRSFRCQMFAYFVFDGDRLVNEHLLLRPGDDPAPARARA